MARVVHKYPLTEPPGVVVEAMFPAGAQFLSVQFQHGTPTLWALVNTGEMRREARRIVLLMTGQEIPEAGILRHLSTLQEADFVLHAFEVLSTWQALGRSD